jgi:uncharacterized protein YcnI
MIRRLLILAAATSAILALAAPAWAHVTVNPREATKGGFAELTFRTPNERPVGTTKLEVFFPADHPLAFVSVKPVPGWKYTVEKTKLNPPIKVHGEDVTEAVSKITWTGGLIRPGEYENFPVSAGPLPEDADSLQFRALQTYQNGEVVRWIQPPVAEGQPEPERPAPVLTLKAEQAAAATGTPAASGQPAGVSQSDVDAASTRGTLGLVLGALGLLLGAGALVVALRRRTPAPSATQDTPAPKKLEV